MNCGPFQEIGFGGASVTGDRSRCSRSKRFALVLSMLVAGFAAMSVPESAFTRTTAEEMRLENPAFLESSVNSAPAPPDERISRGDASANDGNLSNVDRLQIPKPGTMALIGLGLLIIGAFLRRREKNERIETAARVDQQPVDSDPVALPVGQVGEVSPQRAMPTARGTNVTRIESGSA
jgi:hypothetical protein